MGFYMCSVGFWRLGLKQLRCLHGQEDFVSCFILRITGVLIRLIKASGIRIIGISGMLG